MTSTRPYLIRAFYEWIVDNNCTPYIVVNAETLTTEVPREYIDGGQIVLNIAMAAVQELSLGNDIIYFQARFNGIARDINIPVTTIMAIYAKENGRGMVFTNDDFEPPTPSKDKQAIDKAAPTKNGKNLRKKPVHLTVVK